MKLYCLDQAHVTPEARYALEHALHQIGFFFEWTKHPGELDSSRMLIAYGASDLSAVRAAVLRLPARFDLTALTPRPERWHTLEFDGLSLPLLDEPGSGDPTTFPFDLLANIFYHLTRLEEQPCRTPEQADASFADSILHRADQHRVPVVDHLIRYLERFVMEFARRRRIFLLKKTAFPQNESFGLALTHDVDQVRAFHPLKKEALKIGYYLGLQKRFTPQQMDQADGQYWIFDRLLKDYAAGDWKATFFFIARYTEQRHFRYRINSGRFQRLFRQLQAAGQEIGLHPSRFAFDHPDRYRKEKIRLEKFAAAKLTGMRHHYLRCLFPRIWAIAEELNLAYDASLIYNHRGGFRAGTAHPFVAFVPAKRKPLKTVAVPTAFFEKSLPNNGRDAVQNENYVLQLVQNVARVHGILTSLWHTNNIYRDEIAPGFWFRFLNHMKNQPAFKATLADHVRWFHQRRQLALLLFERSDSRIVVQLQLPPELDQFGLILPAERWRLQYVAPHCEPTVLGDALLFSGCRGIRTLELIFSD